MFIAETGSSAAAQRLFESDQNEMGFVMNATRAWAWRPDLFEGFGALRSRLMTATGLSKRDLAVLVCATVAQLGDSYCALAWGNRLASESGPLAAAAVLADSPSETLTDRDRALAAWSRKVVADPNATTQADVDALRAVGLGDREIFEATVLVAFRIAFSSINDALGASPDWQLLDAAPKEVVAAVTFGRAAAPRPGA